MHVGCVGVPARGMERRQRRQHCAAKVHVGLGVSRRRHSLERLQTLRRLRDSKEQKKKKHMHACFQSCNLCVLRLATHVS